MAEPRTQRSRIRMLAVVAALAAAVAGAVPGTAGAHAVPVHVVTGGAGEVHSITAVVGNEPAFWWGSAVHVNGSGATLTCARVVWNSPTPGDHEFFGTGTDTVTGNTWYIHLIDSPGGDSGGMTETPGTGPCLADVPVVAGGAVTIS